MPPRNLTLTTGEETTRIAFSQKNYEYLESESARRSVPFARVLNDAIEDARIRAQRNRKVVGALDDQMVLDLYQGRLSNFELSP